MALRNGTDIVWILARRGRGDGLNLSDKVFRVLLEHVEENLPNVQVASERIVDPRKPDRELLIGLVAPLSQNISSLISR